MRTATKEPPTTQPRPQLSLAKREPAWDLLRQWWGLTQQMNADPDKSDARTDYYCDRLLALEKRIAATRATDIRGAIAKMFLAAAQLRPEWSSETSPDTIEMQFRSAIDDIERLTGLRTGSCDGAAEPVI